MPLHSFILSRPLAEAETPDAALDVVTDPLFERFEGDVTPAVSAGRLTLACAVEAESTRAAVRKVHDCIGPGAEGFEFEPWAPIEIEPPEFEGDNFSAYAPGLPGVVATGRTEAECAEAMRAAVAMHLRGMKEDA